MKIDENAQFLEENRVYAEVNRKLFSETATFAINILGSPGAGKTSLLEKVLIYLRNHIRAAVIEGDLASAKDAVRIAGCNVPVVQINNNDGGYLDAKMINQVLPGFHLNYIDLLLIENVGNLVSPATLDLGEDMKLLVISLPEKDIEPSKYRLAINSAQVVVLNKRDLLPQASKNTGEFKKEILNINPNCIIFETCCRHGEIEGIDSLADYLVSQAREKYRA